MAAGQLVLIIPAESVVLVGVVPLFAFPEAAVARGLGPGSGSEAGPWDLVLWPRSGPGVEAGSWSRRRRLVVGAWVWELVLLPRTGTGVLFVLLASPQLWMQVFSVCTRHVCGMS